MGRTSWSLQQKRDLWLRRYETMCYRYVSSRQHSTSQKLSRWMLVHIKMKRKKTRQRPMFKASMVHHSMEEGWQWLNSQVRCRLDPSSRSQNQTLSWTKVWMSWRREAPGSLWTIATCITYRAWMWLEEWVFSTSNNWSWVSHLP